jgi:hypothetical protein
MPIRACNFPGRIGPADGRSPQSFLPGQGVDRDARNRHPSRPLIGGGGQASVDHMTKII